MEDYYEYLDSNGVTTLYKLIKDDTVALIDSYSVTVNGITTTLDNHVNNMDIHTPIADIENMVDTKISGLVNSAPETLDTLKELSDALGNDPNFANTVANQIGNKASKDDVYTKEETNTLLEGKANSVHNHVVKDITDFPTIPTKVSELSNDSGYITGVAWGDITSKPIFSDIAISGSYNDLVDTPTIPTKTSDLTNDSDFAINSNVVHRTGDETISGNKIFSKTIHRYEDLTTSGGVQVYRFVDTNANPCGHIYNNAHWAVDTIINSVGAYNEKSGKTMEIHIVSNDAGGGMAYVSGSARQYNLETVTSATDFYAIATMGWVNNPATSTNVVHRSGDEYISGVKHFYNAHIDKVTCTRFTHSVNNGSVYITGGSEWDKGATLVLHGEESSDAGSFIINSRDKTRSLYLVGRPDGTLQWAGRDIATTEWVRTYVNSIVGSGSIGASISAYYSNATTVTAEKSSIVGSGSFPDVYSDYINIAPTVGTIYTGSQLFSSFIPTASGIRSSHVHQTTAKATATFSGAFSPSAKYLCTTANAVRFRAYVSPGTISDIGTASVVDNSSAKSIFTRIE